MPPSERRAECQPFKGKIDLDIRDSTADWDAFLPDKAPEGDSQWHTTALCSPTRSTFLTGRNHHQNGFATISESSTGYPGYNSHIPRECASVATVLRNACWSTFWIGKNHNIPADVGTMGSGRRRTAGRCRPQGG